MSSSDPAATPVLEDIIISTGSAPVAVPDFAAVAKNGSRTFQASGPGSLTFNDTDADVNDTLSVIGVTAPSHGMAVLNADGSVTYTPTGLYEGPDAFIYTVSDGLLTASADGVARRALRQHRRRSPTITSTQPSKTRR